MKLVLQRVTRGQVTVDDSVVGSIDTGLVVLVGFGKQDDDTLPDQPIWNTLLRKMLDLRIFPDANGKMNLSLGEYGGKVLLVPQFTLYADTRRGRRPSFMDACPPECAARLFARFTDAVRDTLTAAGRTAETDVQCGIFGAEMHVSLTNWGPVTIILNDADLITA